MPVSQQTAVSQVKLTHEKSRSTAFEEVLLKAGDLVARQIFLVENTLRFVDALLQKREVNSIMCGPNHVWREGSVFCAHMSEHFDVLKTTGRQRNKDICRATAK